MKISVFDKYKIIKTIDNSEAASVYLVEEIETGKKFGLRKLLTNTSNLLYQTAIKEFKQSVKIDKKTSSPSIMEVFIEDGNCYFLLEYKDEANLKMIKCYPSIGKILNNRYVVVQGIACGGFGIVYLVRDLNLPGKYWALKEMQDDGGNADLIEKSFRVEAEMLSTLSYPSIPSIADFFIEATKLYLVMDYVKGDTLKKMLNNLKEGEFFPEEKILNWAISICDVLYYLHSRPTPVVFRDLKPDNIMITCEGDIKLIDFGIARLFHGPKSETTKYALLTEGYAPPEQWMGKAEPRSDVYSLGATLYHLITCLHPRQIAPAFAPVEKFNPSVSPVLSRIIKKSLEPKLKNRYQSISEMKGEFLKVFGRKEKEEKARYHIVRGSKYENDKDYYNANFEYMTALEYDEENPEILMDLAKCCENLSFIDKAIFYYNKTLAISYSDLARDRLDELNKKLASRRVNDIKEVLISPETVPDTMNENKKKRGAENQIVRREDENPIPSDTDPEKKIPNRFLIGALIFVIIIILIILFSSILLLGLWIFAPSIINNISCRLITELCALYQKGQWLA